MINAIRRIYSVPVIDINVKSTGRSRYSELEIKQAMDLYKKVRCFGEVEKQLGVSRNTVRLWAQKYLPAVVAANIKNYNIVNPQRKTRLKPKERMKIIVKTVKDNAMSVSALAEKLGVTIVTIRKDTLALISEGLVVDINKKGFRMVVAA